MLNDEQTCTAEKESVANAVRHFYEQHAYPPAVDDLDRYHRQDVPAQRAEYHLFWPGKPFREARTVLIAGCGTSQAARHAMRWPRASVTGIDVSMTSIRRTEELQRKYGLGNLELRELPIERALELGRSFDQIVCTGVLHHLPAPDAGLRVLREFLAPGGAMHIMVYAPHGRAGIYLVQEYCRRLGIGASSAEIRELAATLGALPKEHPLHPLLHKSPDFLTESGLADALLHPQDRPYSVPQLLEFIKRGGLRFGRWLRQAPYLPHCGAPRNSPHYSRLARLDVEEQYAAMELFRGAMVRHSAIVYRDDEPGNIQGIDFYGDEWLGCTPIQMPEVVCVEERLPPSAAAVLINQSHTDTDIYLPVDAKQKQLYEAIDGSRSIRELIAGHVSTKAARTFFERLWWHDLVVFDSSRCETSRRDDSGSAPGTQAAGVWR